MGDSRQAQEVGAALASALLKTDKAGRAVRLGAAWGANLRHGREYAEAVQRTAIRLFQQATRAPE